MKGPQACSNQPFHVLCKNLALSLFFLLSLAMLLVSLTTKTVGSSSDLLVLIVAYRRVSRRNKFCYHVN